MIPTVTAMEGRPAASTPSGRLFVVGVAAAGWWLILAVAGALPAIAQPDRSCLLQDGHAVIENEEGHETTGVSFNGIRVDIWTGSLNNDCERVSSVAVQNGGEEVETGWSLGYDNIDSTYKTTPQWFQRWTPPGGSPIELNIQRGTPGIFYTLSVQDGDTDTIWRAYLGVSPPVQLGQQMATDYSVGKLVTNGERHTSCDPQNPPQGKVCDSAYSEFNNLKKRSPGGSYTAFTGYGKGPVNTDPWYYFKKISVTHSTVLHCATINC